MDLFHTLNIDFSAILINIAGFVILLLVMNVMFFKPISSHLAGRQQDITATYDKLDADRAEMEALRADYEQRLAAIEAEAREKIQSAIKDAQVARDQILNEAAERSKEIMVRAEADIEREREEALIGLRKQIVELTISATTKIIGEALDDTRQRRLIDDFISSATRPAEA